MTTLRSDEPTISDFTLPQLFDLAGEHDRQGLRRELIISDSTSDLRLFRFPSRIEAVVIGVGIEGETTVQLNHREYRLRRNTLFWFGPQSIVQAGSDAQFRAHLIVISTQLLKRIDFEAKQMLPLFLQFGFHPALDIAPEEGASLRDFLRLIERESREPDGRFSDELVGRLISALVYKTGNLLDRYLTLHDDELPRRADRAEEYFQRFIRTLGEHFRRERSVGFYARELCITPKYLTTLIRRVSGKSVSDWIDIYVTLEAKTLLRFSNRSIQEVAYALNFPNQSFFGSYFKRITGMSPTEFRAQKGAAASAEGAATAR